MNNNGKLRKRTRVRRFAKAQYRYVKILLHEFKYTLMLFVLLLILGTILVNDYCEYPNKSMINSSTIALHLMFMDSSIDFPANKIVMIIFFALPMVGFYLIAEGLARFMVLLFNKKGKMEVWQMALASTLNNHVIVAGLGRVGYRVAKRLISINEDIAVIESNPQNAFIKEMEELNVPVIVGSCGNKDVLHQSKIEAAKSFVIVTDNDLVNIEAALMARELNPNIKIIVRMFNPNLGKFIKNAIGIKTFSTSELAAPAFASAVFSDHIIHAIDIDGTEANMARYTVPAGSPLIGRTINSIEVEFDITFLLHQNSTKRDVHPAQDIILAAGDLIIFLSPLDQLMKIEKMLKA